MLKQVILAILVITLAGCSGLEDSEKKRIRSMNAIGEYIYRTDDEVLYAIDTPRRIVRENYPWEDTYTGNQVRINKEFFRCKGSTQNEPHVKMTNNGPTYVFDCGGMFQHSLPLKEGKEFIYPALIEILNYIQKKTEKKVVITCGHRCPTHNAYADGTSMGRTSKHMIGAEVDFYVKGLEWSPEVVVSLIVDYYKEHSQLGQDARFCEFKRWEEVSNVKALPWYNKEIFIKLFENGALPPPWRSELR